MSSKIPEDCALVLGDFAENYTFVRQDEIQSFHWNKPYCTLHPVVVYHKKDCELMQQSICFISDDLEYDTALVYEVQRGVVNVIQGLTPAIRKVRVLLRWMCCPVQ